MTWPSGPISGDPTSPLSVYGRSKQAGETAVLQASERHWVVRVSWVFGPDRPSFLESLLQRTLEGETVAAIADKVSTPTFTHDAAEWLLPFLDRVDGGGGRSAFRRRHDQPRRGGSSE